jgi:fatty acid desaturase
VIDFRYRREIPEQGLGLWNTLLEIACSLRVYLIFTLIAAGITDASRLPRIYLLSVCILTLNHLRTLAAHRYASDGTPMSHQDQLLDSTNITGVPVFTEILCPVGLRYHALHHLFPRIPYHNLKEAHQRLLDQLPVDSPYRETVYPTWCAAMRAFFHRTQDSAVTVTERCDSV